LVQLLKQLYLKHHYMTDRNYLLETLKLKNEK
jgi:hypothetical protein